MAGDAAALDVPRWLRAVPPTQLALAVLLLRDAYRGDTQRPARLAAIDVMIVALVVLAGQAVVSALSSAGVLNADWLLSPRRAFVFAAGMPMLFGLRLAAIHRLPSLAEEVSQTELANDFRRFERGVVWRNRAILFGGIAAVITAGPKLFMDAGTFAGQAGWAIAFIAGLSVVFYIFVRASVAPLPANASFADALQHYRGELARQSAILGKVWWWYLLSIIPAIAGAIIGRDGFSEAPMLGALHPIQIAAYLLICVLVGLLYAQYARSFLERFATLTTVREQTPANPNAG